MTDYQHGENISPAEERLVQVGRLVLASCTMLCQALAADPAELKLQSIQPCTWPDTSLGLPRPGVVYTPVVTQGYRLRIQRGPDVLTFHPAVQGPPVCAALVPPEVFDADHPLVANAMLDLAEDLQVSFPRITLEQAELQDLQGSPELGADPAQTRQTPAVGHRRRLYVVLKCGAQTYSYEGPLDQALTQQT